MFAHGELPVALYLLYWGYFLPLLSLKEGLFTQLRKSFCILRLTDYSCYLLPWPLFVEVCLRSTTDVTPLFNQVAPVNTKALQK